MSWKAQIQPGPVWSGIEGYAQERIDALTATCINPQSTEADIRAAQAGIAEMRRLIDLPTTIRAEAQQRPARTTRNGY